MEPVKPLSHVSSTDPDLDKTIEVYATQQRLRWNLPHEAEEDLRACGRLGLSEAIARYDGTRGATLKTFADKFISGHIKKGARAMARTLRDGIAARAKLVRSRGTLDSGWDFELEHELWEQIAIAAVTAESGPQFGESPEDKLLREERWATVRQALASLPQEDQELLRALHIQNMNQKDVAAELGINESNVTRRKQDAHARLLKTFSKLDRGRPRGA